MLSSDSEEDELETKVEKNSARIGLLEHWSNSMVAFRAAGISGQGSGQVQVNLNTGIELLCKEFGSTSLFQFPDNKLKLSELGKD